MLFNKIPSTLVLVPVLMCSVGVTLRSQPTLALSSAATGSQGTATLALSLSGTASNPPAALQWSFSYPTAAVSNFSIVAGDALAAAGKTLSCAADGSGYICIASGTNANVIGDGT